MSNLLNKLKFFIEVINEFVSLLKAATYVGLEDLNYYILFYHYVMVYISWKIHVYY